MVGHSNAWAKQHTNVSLTCNARCAIDSQIAMHCFWPVMNSSIKVVDSELSVDGTTLAIYLAGIKWVLHDFN